MEAAMASDSERSQRSKAVGHTGLFASGYHAETLRR